MLADVPLGAFLSGGIDSARCGASMALQSAVPSRPSPSASRRAFNELPWAAHGGPQYATEHHEIVVRAGFVGLIRGWCGTSTSRSGIRRLSRRLWCRSSRRAREGGALGRWRRRAVRAGCTERFLTVQRLARFDRIPQWCAGGFRWPSGFLTRRTARTTCT